jgi:tetratricopeptide (TPR) repeat protein
MEMREAPRLGRIAIGIGALAILVAVGVRYQFERRRPATAPTASGIIDQVRAQLTLAPVLAAETALRARPNDPAARIRLADACAATGDPVGAALALAPIVPSSSRSAAPAVPHPSPGIVRQFVHACAQVGWRDEAFAALGSASPERTQAALELASAFVSHGERERAAALLAAIEGMESAGLTLDDWLNGAMTWYQCREPRRAGRWAERAVRRAVATADAAVADAARTVWVRCLFAAGDLAEVKAALEAKTSGSPSGASGTEAAEAWTYWGARLALRAGDPANRARARSFLASVGTGESLDPVTAFEAGRASLQAGQAVDAARLLNRAARESYQEALAYDLLARAEAALGRPAAAAWARGRVALLRGGLVEAEQQLRRATRLHPSQPGIVLDLARALSLAGKSKAAVELLQQARRQLPNDLDLALAEADALNQQDRFEEQARVLEAAVALDPARAHEPLRNLGRMYYETRQFDRVIPVLERAVAKKETDAVSHRFLGLCYALRPEDPKQAERALTHLLRAAALEPAESTQWTHAGAVLERMGHRPEAAACYRRAIAAVSWVEGPYLSLARALQREGRRAEAAFLLRLARPRRDLQARRRELENRVAAHRGDAAAHLALGELLFQTEGYRNAFPYLLIAASLRPEWGQAQARLADACALLDYVDMWQAAASAANRSASQRSI